MRILFGALILAAACRRSPTPETRTPVRVVPERGSLVVIAHDSASGARVEGVDAELTMDGRTSFAPLPPSAIEARRVLEFRDIPAGRYSLRVHRIGYDSRTTPVLLRANAIDTLQITLRTYSGCDCDYPLVGRRHWWQFWRR